MFIHTLFPVTHDQSQFAFNYEKLLLFNKVILELGSLGSLYQRIILLLLIRSFGLVLPILIFEYMLPKLF